MKTQLNLLTEEELIALCQAQLPYVATAFEELVKRYQKKVFYLCKRYLSTESDAEDATQEIFMKIFHALPRFENRSAFTTWLFSAAINHCKTLLSKRQLHNQRFEYGNDYSQNEFLDDSDSHEEVLKEEDEKKCIQEAISKLKTNERDMISLRFSSELTIEEIAKVLGKKLSATKMSFYRTLEKFKSLYEIYCL